MPVRKFRNLQDIEDSLWRLPDEPSLSVAIARVWDFADRISERHFPPGVHKHRSIEEAQESATAGKKRTFRDIGRAKNPLRRRFASGRRCCSDALSLDFDGDGGRLFRHRAVAADGFAFFTVAVPGALAVGAA